MLMLIVIDLKMKDRNVTRGSASLLLLRLQMMKKAARTGPQQQRHQNCGKIENQTNIYKTGVMSKEETINERGIIGIPIPTKIVS